MIYFTSDIHWNHANICKGATKWYSDNCRNFKDVEEMNAHLIDEINSVVKEDDILYNLGDATFGGIEAIWNLRKQLKVKTIHYVLGNHCHHYERNKVLPNCHYDNFEGNAFNPIDGPNPRKNEPGGDLYDVRAKELFTSVSDVTSLSVDKQQFFMSHYPHLSWGGSNRGVIMLHGHEHGNINHLNEDCKRLDVGIDSAKKILGQYRPFSLQEVLDINESKPLLKLGHHN